MVSAPTPIAAPSAPEFLSASRGVSIAYHRIAGKSPTIVFMGGFMSDMTGAKALAVEAFARQSGHACLRFDYRGHGASSGRFEDGTIGRWSADALTAVDALTTGPLVLVGSSMGGWIALLTQRARPEGVRALVLIAPAPDFTESLIQAELSAEHRAELERAGVVYVPSPYGDRPTPITRALIEDGRNHLVLGGPIAFDGPARILHGMLDPDVPWRHSLNLVDRLTTGDVRLVLVKDGDHRLSREQDLALLTATVGEVLARL
jgi:pimeloyl-ACP methyl ester carboxylesterase